MPIFCEISGAGVAFTTSLDEIAACKPILCTPFVITFVAMAEESYLLFVDIYIIQVQVKLGRFV
jgi:hypothetical protein